LYQAHQDAILLPTDLKCGEYAFGGGSIPSLNASASRDPAGKIHVSICNFDPNRTADLTCEFIGAKASRVSGRILTADAMTAHNTFDKPETVKPGKFNAAKIADNTLSAVLPSKSIVVLEIE
jgi:alpha-N-arabinofuranosidase